jgi:adenylylsulfate kinase-like enzyme
MREGREAVLINGLFGTGKSSVAVEMADILEKRGLPYAVVDLDWLTCGRRHHGIRGVRYRERWADPERRDGYLGSTRLVAPRSR